MAQVRFLLQEPYKKGVRDEVIKRKNEKKSIKSLLNPNQTRIYLWLIVDRKNKVKIKTDEKIAPVQWDFNQQRMIHQCAGSIEFNKRLADLKLDVENLYRKLINDHPNIMFDEIGQNIKTFVTQKHIPIYDEKNKNFFETYDEFVEAKRQDVSFKTIQKYQTLKKSLKDFSAKYYPIIDFKKIDLQFYDKYTQYLRNQKPRGRQKSRSEETQEGLLNDTVSKYIQNLKAFLRWSFERGYHENKIYEHSGFKVIKKASNDIVTLTLPELKKLYEFDLSNNPRLEKVRDVFCFGCFTGQRWSDVEGFEKSQIINNAWNFISKKTKKEIIIPLVGYAEPAIKILRKYDFELPKISSQKFNEYLKEVGEEVKLNRQVAIKRFIGNKEVVIQKSLYKFMSSHMARRTCITILLNVEKLPVTLVQQLTGHTDLKTLQKYINKDSDALKAYLEATSGIKNESYLKVIKDKAI